MSIPSRLSLLLMLCVATAIQQGCVTTQASSQTPQEDDIVRGLQCVTDGHYTRAIHPLQSGLQWLKSDPAFLSSSDELVKKEADYLAKLIQQIQDAESKGVFRSTNPMAQVISSAIEAQAKIIETIDDRRRSQQSTSENARPTSFAVSQHAEDKNANASARPSATAPSKAPFKPGKAMVGVEKCTLYSSSDLDGEVASIDAGTLILVGKEKKGNVLIRTKDGKQGWTRRCYLCTAEEYARRNTNNEIPLRVMCIGAEEDGRTFMYGGSMPIRNGSFALEAGQAFWMDHSAAGASFGVASHSLRGVPETLFLYKDDDSIAKLEIW